jgi:hypothetical protein
VQRFPPLTTGIVPRSILSLAGALMLTLTLAATSLATVNYDFSSHSGFVGRGDVQTALGKPALQTVVFREAQVIENSYRCYNISGFTVNRTARITGGLTGLSFKTATVTRYNNGKKVNETGYLIDGFALALPVADATYECPEGYPLLQLSSIQTTGSWQELRAYATSSSSAWVVFATTQAP